ncbi:MAG: monovalent cation/H(+) antiporter subunit G [Anaeromicrobium sp.]|uniref:monovalent cation/H(+) antiporter subunit G n=1 Tax=Anaeromicrobium sp. TaxID=1929132 RepID=UPI0025CE6B02|nr:monovalent cation/H(+) antiporter subunit G [Anaeromicrobium sp.]MCT4596234.1 monovalent cation/H(+) antiporter subunit G [Anaeromicrobium sp.]
MKMVFITMFLLGGLFFFSVGTIGIIRFPDLQTRIHSAAKCDTLGAVLCLLGLVIYGGISFVSLKILLVIIFIWVTNPTATHLIGKASMKSGEVNNHEDI